MCLAGKSLKKPKWLEEWKRRTRIINIIELAFETDCNCPVCEAVRELGEEMEGLMPPSAPTLPNVAGGERQRARKRRK